MTFLFKGTQSDKQLYALCYAEIDKHEIENQLSRDEKWYSERHSGWTLILNRLTDSINKEGLRYPICVVYKDNKFVCTHGGQRLAASLRSTITRIPCIVAFRDWDLDKIPNTFHILQNVGELDALNHCDVDRINLVGNTLEILVKDRKHWDPNDYI